MPFNGPNAGSARPILEIPSKKVRTPFRHPQGNFLGLMVGKSHTAQLDGALGVISGCIFLTVARMR